MFEYIVGQNTFSVTKVTIYDENEDIYFTDSF